MPPKEHFPVFSVGEGCAVLFVLACRTVLSKDFMVSHHPLPFFSAFTASTSLLLRTGHVSSFKMRCSKIWFSALGKLLVAVSTAAAGMWINTELREQERLPLCLESEQNIGKNAAEKENMCRVVLFPCLRLQADIHDLVKKIGVLQRLHVVIFKCREKRNVAFIFFSSDKLPIAGFTYRTLWVGWEEHDHLDIIFMSKNGMRQGKLLACMWRRLLMQFLLPGVHHYLWWSRDKLACSEEEWTTSGSTHGLAGSIWLHAFLTCIVHLVLWWWEIRRAGDTCGLNGRVRDVEWMKSPWALLSWWEASLRRSCCPPECVHMLKRAIFDFWRDSAWQKSWIVLEI